MAAGTAGMGGSAWLALAGMAALPALAAAQCGSETLTQSTAPSTIQPGRAAWCGTLEFSDQTRIARAFVAPSDLTISCVTFGITSNTGGDWPCIVRVLVGDVAQPHASLIVAGQATVNIPAGTTSELFTAPLPAVRVPQGSRFIVEIETPSRNPDAGGDGALLSLGFNNLGQSGTTYFRSEACGTPEYTDLAALGFPNSHVAMSLGVTPGIGLPVLGGFPITPFGAPVVSVVDGELFAVGQAGGEPFGLTIAYGDASSGVEGSFRFESDEDDRAAQLELVFRGLASENIIRFETDPRDGDSGLLMLDFDDASFDRFNVRVLREGVLVGVLEDQTSGSVVLSDPGNAIRPWFKALLGGLGIDAGCCHERTYFESGGIMSESSYYWFRFGSVAVGPSGGGTPLIGDAIEIVPAELRVDGDPPVSMDIRASHHDAMLAIIPSVRREVPRALIGQARTRLRTLGEEFSSIVGVAVGAVRETGDETPTIRLATTDFDGDGLVDLRMTLDPDAPDAPQGVSMDLGGVVAASTRFAVIDPSPARACVSWCLELGLPPGSPGPFIPEPGPKTGTDPWVSRAGLIAITHDPADIGNDRFTMQVFDSAGVMVFEQAGMEGGIAGGTDTWPIAIGSRAEDELSTTLSYPPGATFESLGGDTFEVASVRLVSEGAPGDQLLFETIVTISNMQELQLFAPETELPPFGVACRADIDGDGALTLFDFLAFLNLFGQGDPIADFDGDGALTLFDFLAFQNEFVEGCD